MNKWIHKVGKRGNCPRARRILFIRLMAIKEMFKLNREETHLANEKTYQALKRGHYPYAFDIVTAVKRERAIKEVMEGLVAKYR